MPRKKKRSETEPNKGIKGIKSDVICTNRDCKLRKQKGCKGFEGCPGFLGR